MKKILLVLLSLFISLPLFAQNNDDEEYSYWNRRKVGGAGGVTPIAGIFDNKEIDKYLNTAGFKELLGSDPIYLIGGEGYGYIMFLKNVRMGGWGASGSRTVSVFEGNMKKEVEYSVTYGGFLVDYVQPVAHKLDVALGASIGGGSVGITMHRDDGKFKRWDSLWIEYGNVNQTSSNYTRRLEGSYVVFNPRINIEYTPLTWFQLRVGIGYPIMFSPEWKLDEKVDVSDYPANIKLNGYTINAGIMFGFFGW